METRTKRLGCMTDVAERLDISTRFGWKLLASGRLIRPLRLGRSVKFDLDELDRWIDAGCPAVEQWERVKAGAGKEAVR